MVSGGVDLVLIIYDQPYGDLRMGKCDLFHQIGDMGSLRAGSL